MKKAGEAVVLRFPISGFQTRHSHLPQTAGFSAPPAASLTHVHCARSSAKAPPSRRSSDRLLSHVQTLQCPTQIGRISRTARSRHSQKPPSSSVAVGLAFRPTERCFADVISWPHTALSTEARPAKMIGSSDVITLVKSKCSRYADAGREE